MKRVFLGVCLFAGVMVGMGVNATDQPSFWREQPASSQQKVTPAHYRAYTLDLAALRRALASLPARIGMPAPDGTSHDFEVTAAQALPPALAARYPDIRSYQGRDGQGRRLRLDISDKGLKAAVYGDAKGVWLVQRADTLSGDAGDAGSAAAPGDVYWSFLRNDLPATPETFREGGVRR